MADLAASDVTVTINSRKIHGDRRYIDVTIAFGDGVLELPTTGVPLPGIANFGMIKKLDFINLYQPTDAAGHTWYVDAPNEVIELLAKVKTKGTVAAVSIRGEAVGW
ncbi:MAG: hypothetical protein ACYSR0_12250 [Planctomycetota bacterium]|jgi:hypothetical protein